LGNPKKKFGRMKSWWKGDQCLQDEGVDCSSHHIRAFVWNFEGSTQMLSYNRLNFISFQDRQKGLGVDGCPWFYILEGRGGSSNLPVGIIPFASPSNEGLWFKKFHSRFMSGWRWRFHPT